MNLFKKIPKFSQKLASQDFVGAKLIFPETNVVKSLTIAPILIKDQKLLQFVYFEQRKSITKNYTYDDVSTILEEFKDLLTANVKFLTETIVFKNGKVKTNPATNAPPTLENDRKKNYIIPENTEFLERIGISKSGRVLPTKRAKYTQINEFLRLFDQTGILKDQKEIKVVDFGCGLAYLTIALHHFIKKREIIPIVTGVDVNPEVIQKATILAQNYNGMKFETNQILKYETKEVPDVVVALHACNTATDQSILRGILWNSKVVITAPCCHHDLKIGVNSPFKKHGIIEQRFQDILTDTMRALLLRICGYKTDVIEFVSPEHTNKNIMIRSVFDNTFPKSALQDYLNLKETWKVKPKLEELLIEKGYSGVLFDEIQKETK
jgi:SAM-dependent methyltransferase